MLTTISHNEQNRVMAERFQHLRKTTSQDFNKALRQICHLGKELIAPPSFNTTPLKIQLNPKYYPYIRVIQRVFSWSKLGPRMRMGMMALILTI